MAELRLYVTRIEGGLERVSCFTLAMSLGGQGDNSTDTAGAERRRKAEGARAGGKVQKRLIRYQTRESLHEQPQQRNLLLLLRAVRDELQPVELAIVVPHYRA